MKLLNTEKARMLLAHPLVNQTEVARRFYEGKKKTKRPLQALRIRVYGNPARGDAPDEISGDTLERLTKIFARLYHDIVDDDIII